MSEQTQRAINAIRLIDTITCADIAEIFAVMASKMQAAGFSDLDLEAIDEARGFVCGETV